MSSRTPAVVLVDPLSSSWPTRDAAKNSGYATICWITMPLETLQSPKWSMHAPHAQKLDGDHGFDGMVIGRDLDDAYRSIAALGFDVRGVIACSENGVEFADAMATRFGTPSNDPTLALARREKALMKEAARAAGLRCAQFARCFNFGDAEAFMRTREYPVVVKTPAGSGTVGVRIVNSLPELKGAVTEVLALTDNYGARPEFLVLEEFLGGTEYIVNLFGDGQEIRVTDIWEYEKVTVNGVANMYYNTWQVDHLAPEYAELCEYARKLSRALGVTRGPLHAEIKVDSKGPVMIEITARFCGLRIPNLMARETAFDGYRASVEVFTAGTTQIPAEVRWNKRFAVVTPVLEVGGRVRSVRGLDEIQKLSSYHSHMNVFPAGSIARRTEDLHDVPLYLWLAHSDVGQLKRDAAEAHRLYGIEVES